MLLARCRPSQQRLRSRECRCGIPDIEPQSSKSHDAMELTVTVPPDA